MSSDVERVDQGDAAELAHAPDGMQLAMRGQFAIYARADGGMELFFDVGNGRERKTVPRPIVAAMTGNGPMGAMFRKMFGGKE